MYGLKSEKRMSGNGVIYDVVSEVLNFYVSSGGFRHLADLTVFGQYRVGCTPTAGYSMLIVAAGNSQIGQRPDVPVIMGGLFVEINKAVFIEIRCPEGIF